MTKTNVLGDEIPKENVHYTCELTIDSVMRMEKKNYTQVYLEECKYKIKKIKKKENKVKVWVRIWFWIIVGFFKVLRSKQHLTGCLRTLSKSKN